MQATWPEYSNVPHMYNCGEYWAEDSFYEGTCMPRCSHHEVAALQSATSQAVWPAHAQFNTGRYSSMTQGQTIENHLLIGPHSIWPSHAQAYGSANSKPLASGYHSADRLTVWPIPTQKSEQHPARPESSFLFDDDLKEFFESLRREAEANTGESPCQLGQDAVLQSETLVVDSPPKSRKRKAASEATKIHPVKDQTPLDCIFVPALGEKFPPLFLQNIVYTVDLGQPYIDLKQIFSDRPRKSKAFNRVNIRAEEGNVKGTGLVYSTGKMIVNGVRQLKHIDKCAEALCKKLQNAGAPVQVGAIAVSNLVASFDFGRSFDLQRLHGHLGLATSYERELFPALTWAQSCPDATQSPKSRRKKRIVANLFHSGKGYITGAKSEEKLVEAYKAFSNHVLSAESAVGHM